MMYGFMTFPDNTTITHSEKKEDGTVKVYVETPDERDGFHNAWCTLPTYKWDKIFGYTDDEIRKYQDIIESVAHLIMDYSERGGFENAANF